MSVSDSIDKDILSFFKKLKDKRTDYINKLIVSSYVESHQLKVGKRNFLYNYLIDKGDETLTSLLKTIRHSHNQFGMEELVEVFEFVISPADKEVNGAVYTPAFIREFIVRRVLAGYDKERWLDLLYADLSCGCGGFFYTLIKIIREEHADFSISDFLLRSILGVDIKGYSVERTKILLSLYALQEGEELRRDVFNIFCQNSLSNEFMETRVVLQNGGIDIVIGNPPYVASSKMSEENRQYVKNWSVSKTGKSDLYLPFFQLSLDSLKPGGTLGYITVNTFYRSLNGGAFRNYLSEKGLDFTIVDFGAEQLFRGCSTYTCICIIRNIPTDRIHYQETASGLLSFIHEDAFEDISYKTLDNKKGWILKDKKTSSNIGAIESTGTPLGKVVEIRNGFATLRNDVYLIRPIRKDRKFFYFEKKGSEFKVERAVCREAIKANLVRQESDIETLREYIIFPYRSVNGQQEVIDEEVFQRNYPFAYHYLEGNREELAKRDNGHKKYPKWYAYGRSQALNIQGKRLLLPHICDTPCFVFCDNENLLFYDGYSILAETPRQLEIIKRILSSDIFWYYITKTSKPYSGGFFSLEKRYIQHFGIPRLTEEQENMLLSLHNQDEVNEWLSEVYGIWRVD